MNQLFMATLGGLIGSVLTVTISRICDIIQRRMDHIYSLRKLFFDKKLSVAEAVISKRHIYASILQNISILLDEISKNVVLVLPSSPNVLKPFIDGLAQQIQKLNNPKLEIASGVNLFFDIEELEYFSLSKEALGIVISLSVHNLILQASFDKFFKEENPEERIKILNTTRTLVEDMRKEIIYISEKLKIGSQQESKIVNKIRSEMKKFES